MIEKIVADLKNIFTFKDTTGEGDIVLLVAESLMYAVVTEIERDTTRKDEWWHVGMQLLSIPPQKFTWTLREPQFTGQEIFTMGGEERFVKAIDFGVGGKKVKKKAIGGKEETKRKKGPVLTLLK
ncbi:hypothetical protein ACUUL3_09350 [Thiovibrio sp. JS02]